ncbi:MAG: hypothetical protein M1832_001202 [Thelocarpon impressellum]|nr:MAG: hypothetical protein M1832_001202 [Thelocarpon impressellum]
MYYILYLSSEWFRVTFRPRGEPRHDADGLAVGRLFLAIVATGYTCTARVNHREYQTDTVYESETLARENAAMRAYLICRNFSVADGMYPAGHRKGGVVQGLPVAIGTGRHSTYDAGSSGSGGYTSGGSSPRSSDSGADDGGRRVSRMSRSLAYGTVRT